MHKFFVAESSIDNYEALIEGDDFKHISKVLRLKIGDKIALNNCSGREFIAEIKLIEKKSVRVKIISELPVNNESKLEIYLFQGLPKSTKMDLIVQKATELGVREITPIITERVIVKNNLNEFKKKDRWEKIILEACKQSKRSTIPKVKLPITFEELIEEIKEMDLVVVPYEEESGLGIKNIIPKLTQSEIKKAAVIIGPEGGFEVSEIEKLKEMGAYIVTLGPRILRTETAGFVCTSILQYELGDLGGFEI